MKHKISVTDGLLTMGLKTRIIPKTEGNIAMATSESGMEISGTVQDKPTEQRSETQEFSEIVEGMKKDKSDAESDERKAEISAKLVIDQEQLITTDRQMPSGKGPCKKIEQTSEEERSLGAKNTATIPKVQKNGSSDLFKTRENTSSKSGVVESNEAQETSSKAKDRTVDKDVAEKLTQQMEVKGDDEKEDADILVCTEEKSEPQEQIQKKASAPPLREETYEKQVEAAPAKHQKVPEGNFSQAHQAPDDFAKSKEAVDKQILYETILAEDKTKKTSPTKDGTFDRNEKHKEQISGQEMVSKLPALIVDQNQLEVSAVKDKTFKASSLKDIKHIEEELERNISVADRMKEDQVEETVCEAGGSPAELISFKKVTKTKEKTGWKTPSEFVKVSPVESGISNTPEEPPEVPVATYKSGMEELQEEARTRKKSQQFPNAGDKTRQFQSLVVPVEGREVQPAGKETVEEPEQLQSNTEPEEATPEPLPHNTDKSDEDERLDEYPERLKPVSDNTTGTGKDKPSFEIDLLETKPVAERAIKDMSRVEDGSVQVAERKTDKTDKLTPGEERKGRQKQPEIKPEDEPETTVKHQESPYCSHQKQTVQKLDRRENKDDEFPPSVNEKTKRMEKEGKVSEDEQQVESKASTTPEKPLTANRPDVRLETTQMLDVSPEDLEKKILSREKSVQCQLYQTEKIKQTGSKLNDTGRKDSSAQVKTSEVLQDQGTEVPKHGFDERDEPDVTSEDSESKTGTLKAGTVAVRLLEGAKMQPENITGEPKEVNRGQIYACRETSGGMMTSEQDTRAGSSAQIDAQWLVTPTTHEKACHTPDIITAAGKSTSEAVCHEPSVTDKTKADPSEHWRSAQELEGVHVPPPEHKAVRQEAEDPGTERIVKTRAVTLDPGGKEEVFLQEDSRGTEGDQTLSTRFPSEHFPIGISKIHNSLLPWFQEDFHVTSLILSERTVSLPTET